MKSEVDLDLDLDISEILINLADALVNAGAALRAQVRGEKVYKAKPRRDRVASFDEPAGVKPKPKAETVQAPIPQKPTLCTTCGVMAVYRIAYSSPIGHELHDVCANCGDLMCECDPSDLDGMLHAAEALHGKKGRGHVVRSEDTPEDEKKPAKPATKRNTTRNMSTCPLCKAHRQCKRIDGLQRYICTNPDCGYVSGTDPVLSKRAKVEKPVSARRCPDCDGIYRYRRTNGGNHYVCDDCGRTSTPAPTKADRLAEIQAAHKRLLDRKAQGVAA